MAQSAQFAQFPPQDAHVIEQATGLNTGIETRSRPVLSSDLAGRNRDNVRPWRAVPAFDQIDRLLKIKIYQGVIVGYLRRGMDGKSSFLPGPCEKASTVDLI
jgi:hypothetical protein